MAPNVEGLLLVVLDAGRLLWAGRIKFDSFSCVRCGLARVSRIRLSFVPLTHAKRPPPPSTIATFTLLPPPPLPRFGGRRRATICACRQANRCAYE